MRMAIILRLTRYDENISTSFTNTLGEILLLTIPVILTKPTVQGIAITDEDKNGFMSCIH